MSPQPVSLGRWTRPVVEAVLADRRVHDVARRAMLVLAQRLNFHVVRGMADARVRPEPGLFARAAPWKITQDYVRDAALELICREVRERSVPGALAELGVFRGDFAWLMATYLPGRRVHLFDTFAGFDERQVAEDRAIVEAFHDFSATDPEAVRARFEDPQTVQLHVGLFPETTEGVEDRFALVSLDADLYAPILSGLRWFHPRMSPGGAILVHDFNNGAYGGAKRAVREFQRETGVTCAPLPDWGGTAVITVPGPEAGEPARDV